MADDAPPAAVYLEPTLVPELLRNSNHEAVPAPPAVGFCGYI